MLQTGAFDAQINLFITTYVVLELNCVVSSLVTLIVLIQH